MALEQRSKQDFWQQHITYWRQSRLSQKEYCKQNDISFSSFGYWRTRLNRSSKTGSKLIGSVAKSAVQICQAILSCPEYQYLDTS